MSLKPTRATQGISEQLELHSELRLYLKNKTTKPEIVHCLKKRKKEKKRKGLEFELIDALRPAARGDTVWSTWQPILAHLPQGAQGSLVLR